MPNTRLDLEGVRNAVVGQEQTRGVTAAPKSPNTVVNGSSGARVTGKTKMVFRKEHNLSDFIEVDYNPEKLPVRYSAKYNDKAVIGGDDAVEWQGINKREFPIELLFNDFGYHRTKGFKESADYKLGWLQACITRPLLQVIDGKAMTLPPVVFVEFGSRAFRAVIIKIDGYEEMQDNISYDPIRAKVSITVRVIRRKRGTKPPA